jgi:hypothetical protein
MMKRKFSILTVMMLLTLFSIVHKANAYILEVNVAPTIQLSVAMICTNTMVHYEGRDPYKGGAFVVLSDGVAPEPHNFEFILADGDPFGTGEFVLDYSELDFWTLIGLYDDDGNKGITIGSQKITIGNELSDYFEIEESIIIGYFETFLAYLEGWDPTAGPPRPPAEMGYIHDFYDDYLFGMHGGSNGQALSLYNFSTASYGGNADLKATFPEPVPEPATIILLGAGVAGIMGATRKRFKK